MKYHGIFNKDKVCTNTYILQKLLKWFLRFQINGLRAASIHFLFQIVVICFYRYNSVAVARLLVTRGADVSIKNVYGSTALHFAARRGNTEIAKLLIDQQNCDVNAKDNALVTPLHQAAISGDSEITEELIKRGADVFAVDIDNENPLHFAAEEGSDEVVDVILKSCKFHLCYGKYLPLSR